MLLRFVKKLWRELLDGITIGNYDPSPDRFRVIDCSTGDAFDLTDEDQRIIDRW